MPWDNEQTAKFVLEEIKLVNRILKLIINMKGSDKVVDAYLTYQKRLFNVFIELYLDTHYGINLKINLN